MKRWTTLAAVALAVTACHDAAGPRSELRLPQPGVVNASKSVPIPGSYIITLRDEVSAQDVDNTARSLAALHKAALHYVYKAVLKGFAASNLSDAEVAALTQDSRVARIEADQVMSASTIQTPVTWGLDRIDQRALPLSNSYSYSADGTGVTAYIIDTGIQITHSDFGGRASVGVDEINDGRNGIDCNGHGTHVSGTVAGQTYGVAKNASLVAVRVLDCTGFGSNSGVIAGINWVASQQTCFAPAGPKCGIPAVANMSLGGGFSPTLNMAVANAVNGCVNGSCNAAAGVTFAVAAGNNTADACNFSPSSEPSAITVAATDRFDNFASFSNRGPCVDIAGPGVNVTSDWIGPTNTAINTISGTSMATPHVTGAAALYVSVNPNVTPAQVASALTSNATTGTIIGIPAQTVNLLLYTGFITNNPVVTITVTPNPASVASGGTQQFTATGADALGNPVTITPTWSVVAGGGTIDGNGLFTAGTVAGTYTNTVTASSGGVTGTATVTVMPGPLASIVVTPNPVTMSWGSSRQFTAVGSDAFGNAVTITPTWSVINGGGIINTTGRFTAGSTTGTFSNTVQASSGTISGTATVVVVRGSTPCSVPRCN